MDEVFGSENFINIISFQKTSSQGANFLSSVSDYILWYGRDISKTKFRPILLEKKSGKKGAKQYTSIISGDFSEWRKMTPEELAGSKPLPLTWKIFRFGPTTSQGHQESRSSEYTFEGEKFNQVMGYIGVIVL